MDSENKTVTAEKDVTPAPVKSRKTLIRRIVAGCVVALVRSEEHTSELQSL